MNLDQVQKEVGVDPSKRANRKKLEKNPGPVCLKKKRKVMNYHGKKIRGIEDNTGSCIPFVEIRGLSRQALQLSTIMDVFNLFILLTLVQTWVDETNRYAAEIRNRKPSNMKWINVSLKELLAYIEMVIAMGLVNLTSMLDYFATEPILSHPWFPSILRRDRFLLNSRYFHTPDDAQIPGDKLGKVCPFVDNLIASFQKHWTSHREISID